MTPSLTHPLAPARRPTSAPRFRFPSRLSVVVPAYREPRIGDTVDQLRHALSAIDGDGGVEILIVDDGSGDDTPQRALAAGADRVIRQPANRGKGAAVRVGVLAATGRTIAFTDADLAYSPDQLVDLLDHVERGWDAVVGSRHHEATRTIAESTLVRRLGHHVIHSCTTAVLDDDHADTQCGLKAFRAEVAQAVFGRSRIDGFAFDVEIFCLLERFGCTVLEVPVWVENSSTSTVRVGRDALGLLRDLARIHRAARSGAYDPVPEAPGGGLRAPGATRTVGVGSESRGGQGVIRWRAP